MDIKSVIKDHNYKVLVNCMTYNQSQYIEDALNGFAMQQTNFPYVCLVMDDASTDGEQDVIKAFLERECNKDDADCYEIDEANIIIARHKGNHNCTFAVYFLKQNLFGTSKKKQLFDEWRSCCKYEAWCEGDDYWTAPLKLQKQLDFLDTHPDYSMCFHRAKILLETNVNVWLYCCSIEDRDYSASELFAEWKVPTASMVYRVDCLDYPIVDDMRIINGDIVLVEKCAHSGLVRGFSDFMSIYRVQPSGLTLDSSRTLRRTLAYPGHFECIRESFPNIDDWLVREKIANCYFDKMMVDEKENRIKDLKLCYKASKKVCRFRLFRAICKVFSDSVTKMLR